MFDEKQLQLLHHNPNTLLVEDSRIQTVRFIDQLCRLQSVVDDLDAVALPLILTGFAIDGLLHQLVNIFVRMVFGGSAHMAVHGDVGPHTATLREPELAMGGDEAHPIVKVVLEFAVV